MYKYNRLCDLTHSIIETTIHNNGTIEEKSTRRFNNENVQNIGTEQKDRKENVHDVGNV